MMTCTYCEGQPSCLLLPIHTAVGDYYPIPNGSTTCSDCGAHPNGLHHPGCLNEECPQCHKQLATCGCILEVTIDV